MLNPVNGSLFLVIPAQSKICQANSPPTAERESRRHSLSLWKRAGVRVPTSSPLPSCNCELFRPLVARGGAVWEGEELGWIAGAGADRFDENQSAIDNQSDPVSGEFGVVKIYCYNSIGSLLGGNKFQGVQGMLFRGA